METEERPPEEPHPDEPSGNGETAAEEASEEHQLADPQPPEEQATDH